MLKSSGAIQAIVLDISKVFTESVILVFFTSLPYMPLRKGVLSCESFCSGDRLCIVLKDKSFSKCATNAGMFFLIFFALNEQKKLYKAV